MKTRSETLIEAYGMEKHVEGGSFTEVYTSAEEKDGRALAGSIYFLLGEGETSCFHEIDCEEIWYYHEGCGMRITALADGERREYLLGGNVQAGERASVVIPRGCLFAAENLESDGFTFVSCITVPKFAHAGYRLIDKSEIKRDYPAYYGELAHLAY